MRASMNCPRCNVELLEVTPDPELDDIEALHCPQCKGHWLEQEDLHRLEAVTEVEWFEVRHIPHRALQDEPLTCPRCAPARHLVKLKSERDHKVVMDACTSCRGVWLDGGELHAIQHKSVLAALVDALRYLVKA